MVARDLDRGRRQQVGQRARAEREAAFLLGQAVDARGVRLRRCKRSMRYATARGSADGGPRTARVV